MSQSKKKILIIDDESSITLLLSAMLKQEYQIEIAQDSQEAIIKIYEFNPDLITADLNMPGLEGDELLPVIKAWKPYIPVIMISANKSDKMKKKCFENGAASFIVKPFSRTILLDQIKKTINSETQLPKFSENIIDEVELAIGILQNKGIISDDQVSEEINAVKSRLNN